MLCNSAENVTSQISRRGFIFIISAPSGVGKSTLIRHLTQTDNTLKFSISVTTRERRDGEQNGVDYYFKTKPEFYSLIEQGAFLEYAEVYGNLYGTLRNEVMNKIEASEDIIMDVDLQGAALIKEQLPNDTLSIYILPPSLQELERRITSRNQDSQDSLHYRIARSVNELRWCSRYHYLVINDNIEHAVSHIQQIIATNRRRIDRMNNLDDVVNKLTLAPTK